MGSPLILMQWVAPKYACSANRLLCSILGYWQTGFRPPCAKPGLSLHQSWWRTQTLDRPAHSLDKKTDRSTSNTPACSTYLLLCGPSKTSFEPHLVTSAEELPQFIRAIQY